MPYRPGARRKQPRNETPMTKVVLYGPRPKRPRNAGSGVGTRNIIPTVALWPSTPPTPPG
eukprot:1332248-Lingulodinium_polyedra.AAC.1